MTKNPMSWKILSAIIGLVSLGVLTWGGQCADFSAGSFKPEHSDRLADGHARCGAACCILVHVERQGLGGLAAAGLSGADSRGRCGTTITGFRRVLVCPVRNSIHIVLRDMGGRFILESQSESWLRTRDIRRVGRHSSTRFQRRRAAASHQVLAEMQHHATGGSHDEREETP